MCGYPACIPTSLTVPGCDEYKNRQIRGKDGVINPGYCVLVCLGLTHTAVEAIVRRGVQKSLDMVRARLPLLC